MSQAFPGFLDEIRERRMERALLLRSLGRGAPKKGESKKSKGKGKK